MKTKFTCSVLLLFFFQACIPSAQNQKAKPAGSQETVHSYTATSSYIAPFPLPKELETSKPDSLWSLPVSEEGAIILDSGFYEGQFKSYCLQPGSPDPSNRDVYGQAPLQTYRQDIVETIIRSSVKNPALDQRDVQLLLWSVLSGADYNRLSWELQHLASDILSRKQLFQLKGGVMGFVKNVSNVLPEAGATSGLKDLFELGTSSYDLYERLAVPRQPSVISNAAKNPEEWHWQPAGYYLRYFPSGYQRTKVQVYVPATAKTLAAGSNSKYLLFDPVSIMAVPANSNAQRLGIGAPVVDIIRKVIKISQQGHTNPPPPPPKKNQKPVLKS